MIRLRTALRTMPAFWFAIPLCIFAAWYASVLYAPQGYAVGATAAGTGSLPFVGPLCAAFAAWEGSRLRRARLWDAPSVRSRATVASWCLLPVVLVGLLAVIAAITVQLVQTSAGLPDLRFIAMTALDLVALCIMGFAAGLLLPFAVAGPLAIAVTFVWLAFVPAIQPVWLRHLTGMFRDCCSLHQDLDPRALLASSIVDLGILGAAAVLVATPLRLNRRVGGAFAALALAGAAGVMLVGGTTYAPVVPRDTALLECRSDSGLTVCTWPEHRARAVEVAGIVTALHAGWKRASIDVASVFTEADPTVAPPGAFAFRFLGEDTEDDIIRALAAGRLPAWPECAGGATGGSALEYLEGWYAAAGGMSTAGLQERYGQAGDGVNPGVLAVVDQLSVAAPDVQRAWVSRAGRLSQACDEWPLDLAVHP